MKSALKLAPESSEKSSPKRCDTRDRPVIEEQAYIKGFSCGNKEGIVADAKWDKEPVRNH